jgi:hypothetical protein
MKRSLLAVVALVALAGCAGVHGGANHVSSPCWDGNVLDVDAATKPSWLGVSILPCLWGGLGFNVNGEQAGLNVFPLHAEANFVEPAAPAK